MSVQEDARGWELRVVGRHYIMRWKAGAERASAVAESALAGAKRAGAVAKRNGGSREDARERLPAVAIPEASYDIGDTLYILPLTYV